MSLKITVKEYENLIELIEKYNIKKIIKAAKAIKKRSDRYQSLELYDSDLLNDEDIVEIFFKAEKQFGIVDAIIPEDIVEEIIDQDDIDEEPPVNRTRNLFRVAPQTTNTNDNPPIGIQILTEYFNLILL
jgi:hypothetical protein